MNPIIVTGAPYSGTSVVARLLQTRIDIVMDEGPLRTDAFKPLGYYEDHKLIEINKIAYSYILARIGTNCGKVPAQWAIGFASWLAYRDGKYSKWGWKDPGAVAMAKHIHQFVDNPTWIVCQRKDEQIIKSQVEKGGFPKEIAKQGLIAYNTLIKRELKDKCVHFVLSEWRSEKNIVEELQGILNGRC